MKSFEEYRAINFYHGNPQGTPSLVAMHPDDPERFHWNGGQAYCTGIEGKQYTTLKVYKVAEFVGNEDTDAEDAIEVQYYRDFFPAMSQPPKDTPAWIAPDGAFYPCHYREHDSIGKRLAAWFYHSLSISVLEENGWIRLEDNGSLYHLGQFSGHLTQSQLDTLGDILQISIGSFQRAIEGEIRRAIVQ